MTKTAAGIDFTDEEVAIVEEFHRSHYGLSAVYDRLYGMLLGNSEGDEFMAKTSTLGFLEQLDKVGLQLVTKE